MQCIHSNRVAQITTMSLSMQIRNQRMKESGVRKDSEHDLVQPLLKCLLENPPLSTAQSIFSEALQITYLRTLGFEILGLIFCHMITV